MKNRYLLRSPRLRMSKLISSTNLETLKQVIALRLGTTRALNLIETTPGIRWNILDKDDLIGTVEKLTMNPEVPIKNKCPHCGGKGRI